MSVMVSRTMNSPVPASYTETPHSEKKTFWKTFVKGRMDPTLDQSLMYNSAIT